MKSKRAIQAQVQPMVNLIPDGAMLMECYETATEIIICGDPINEQDHNCDQMGCSSINHVRYIFRKDI